LPLTSTPSLPSLPSSPWGLLRPLLPSSCCERGTGELRWECKCHSRLASLKRPKQQVKHVWESCVAVFLKHTAAHLQ
jgi:hypothetical protein